MTMVRAPALALTRSGLGPVLLLILAVAAALRLEGVTWGLPALYDPDEPLFVMTALELIRNRSLNPHWFGHPGTTTIYTLALIDLAVALANIGSAATPTAAAFADAVYADPGIVFLPGRLFIAACGLLCVYLTFRLGRSLVSARVGLIAAALLAICSLHIRYSQIIRTDMHASVFLLLALLSMIAAGRNGRMRDYLLAGLCIGLACATKWPSAVFAAGMLGVGVWRMRREPGELHRVAAGLASFGAAALVALVVASPYLLLDHATLLSDLHAEGRPHHPGHTGSGWIGNLVWYASGPLLGSFGALGLAAVAGGTVVSVRDDSAARWVVVPAAVAFVAAIVAQVLIWERWVVPLLPLLAVFMGIAIDRLAALAGARRRAATLGGVLALVAAPMLWTTWLDLTERHRDTRDEASAWLRQNGRAGSTVLLEHGAIDLLPAPYRFIFPLGDLGCVDGRAALAGKVRYARIDTKRSQAPVLDLGGVPAPLLPSCRADYAIFTHYDPYLTEPEVFSAEIAKYRALVRGGREVATFRPRRGVLSGPVVHVVELRR